MPSYKEIGGGLGDYEDRLEDECVDMEEDEYEDKQDEIGAALSEEALKVLSYRQKLKEQLRSKLRQENGICNSASPDKSLKSILKSFGTFFGPSMPVISDRAIQETKRLLETPRLASKSSTSENDPISVIVSSDGQIDGMSEPHPQTQTKMKAQILKDIRDYSFLLSDDAEIPKPSIGPRPEQGNNPSSQPGQIAYSSDENKKPLKNTRVSNTCTAPQKLNYGARCEPTQQPSEKPLSSVNKRDPVCLMKRLSVGPVGDKVLYAPKNFMSDGQRPSFKLQAFGNNNSNVSEHNRDLQNKSKGNVLKKGKDEDKLFKQSSVQANIQNKLTKKQKPDKSIQLSSNSANNNHHKKVQRSGEALSDDECDYRSIIQNMFGYRPSRYVDDDMCMEAGFDTIRKEELRSAKIAKREDEEELAKILEEERLERLRKKAKMHKIRQ